jgi:hypothetical protein
MDETAISLSTTTAALAKMTALDQLDYVKKFFEDNIAIYGKPTTLGDTYLMVFSPAFVGKSADFVCYTSGSPQYLANSGYDTDKDGNMTKGEIETLVTTTTADVQPFEVKTLSTPELASDIKIEAKTMDDVVLVGDSHA